MSFDQEINYCVDCHRVAYPAEFEPCDCNGKYPMVVKAGLEQALEISKMMEDRNVNVELRDGKLCTSVRPIRTTVKDNAEHTDDALPTQPDEGLHDTSGIEGNGVPGGADDAGGNGEDAQQLERNEGVD